MKKIIVSFFVVSLLIIPLVAFALDGSFSLSYGGGSHNSNDKKLEYPYPYIDFYNHNESTDAELAASVLKKGLFGYTLKGRQQKWVTGTYKTTYYYGNYGTGTYRATFVINRINGNGYVSGAYLFSSREV